MNWTPHITVAAIIERDGKFLVVEEKIGGERVFNQPAGHLEKNETLVEAVIREVREETAWRFEPMHIVGVYRMHIVDKDITYLRVCFAGMVSDHRPQQALDTEIVANHWLAYDEIVARKSALRSPMVLRCIDDYLAGNRFDPGLLKDLGNV